MKLKPLLRAATAAALLTAAGAHAAPFTVLSNNASTDNLLLYVELMYEQPACGDYKALFFRKSRNSPDSVPIPVDSFLNNPNTFTTDAAKMSLMRPKAGGYRLRFKLPDVENPQDSGYQICVGSYMMAYKCVGCGAAGSDAIFSTQDIDPACPYPNAQDDLNLMACWQRQSRAAGWEAWVFDPRDCQPYRIVRMEGTNQWWFAQNLRYGQAGKCPTGQDCAREGLLYNWFEAMTGRKDDGTSTSYPALVYDAVGPTGICPEGWHLPADFEWGQLGYAAGSLANTYEPWQGGAQGQLAATDGFFPLAGLRTAYDGFGFSWRATPFEGAAGIGGGSLRAGAYWSALRPGLDQSTDSVNRVALAVAAGAWAVAPLTVDANRGAKQDYLPVRCLLGRGGAPGPVVNIATPQLTAQSACSGDTVAFVSNVGSFNSLNFYVDGTVAQQGVDPYLVINNAPSVTQQHYEVWARGSNAAGFFSRPAPSFNVTITQTLKGALGAPADKSCPTVRAGFIGTGY
jgi:uncharacterized protein (TIGR02145 family)